MASLNNCIWMEMLGIGEIYGLFWGKIVNKILFFYGFFFLENFIGQNLLFDCVYEGDLIEELKDDSFLFHIWRLRVMGQMDSWVVMVCMSRTILIPRNV